MLITAYPQLVQLNTYPQFIIFWTVKRVPKGKQKLSNEISSMGKQLATFKKSTHRLHKY